MTTLIHPTAVIHPGAELHPTVQVGAYAVIGEHVKVRAGTSIGHHVVIEGKTDIGERNQFFPGAAIGLEPQDLKYDGSLGLLKIGNGNQIREFVTIHRPTYGEDVTLIGNGNLLMAYTHVGHNCAIEDQVIISNSVSLAGHVHIESKARISGVLGVHQFVRIGRHAMVGGMARIDRDVPPYMIVEGNPGRIRALHKIGLQRSGFSVEDLQLLRKAFRILYRSDLRLTEALDQLDLLPDNEHVQHLQQFIRLSILPGRRGLTPVLLKGGE
ncbi:acyl-ACP--UDP-N-acetylglucosamine O-acyltransferase [Myxacorys almedinensis]|uniref:Acyl-[acyl-carrier-protein]--UDP-N-acetylglucosamine O-acyltransferase n=1 Tax=Myxacorys almedinensis A TaxID=2690445 RepID=A0A8J7YW70_9CYAN|nr:acyl-ACP--UDP-N-acetylglucosamine O-acyltransferase [Myxacorys almedinensis]NDJ15734.1 acyl-ACP--UDP-N-acetylglucosamine O-acyltransferase [Myxacorys almedinensis A]